MEKVHPQRLFLCFSEFFEEEFCQFGKKLYLCSRFVPLGLEKVGYEIASPRGRKPFLTNLFNKKMYVIVEINGQQFKAEEGKRLFVHHIKDVDAQATVEFENVLLVDNDGSVTVGTPTVEGAKVVCEVKTPLVKGDKVYVFHKRRRKGYRKFNGHRQQFTELTIKQVIG